MRKGKVITLTDGIRNILTKYNKAEGFFIRSNEDPVCPVCEGKLKKKGWTERSCKNERGQKTIYMIEVRTGAGHVPVLRYGAACSSAYCLHSAILL